MQRKQLFLPILLALPLASCSPPAFDIIAQRDGEGILFTARDNDNGAMRYVEASSLRVSQGVRTLWHIERATTDACRQAPHPPHPFPLRFGEVPPCWVQTRAPEPLQNPGTYSVLAEGGSKRGGGDFRLEGDQVIFIDTYSNW
jgi:hypothetical protein